MSKAGAVHNPFDTKEQCNARVGNKRLLFIHIKLMQRITSPIFLKDVDPMLVVLQNVSDLTDLK